MDRKLYPNASQVYPAADLLTTPVLTDIISLIRSNQSEKFLSIVNLITKLAKLGLAPTVYTASGAIDPAVAYVQLEGGAKLEMTIAAPVANQLMIITQTDARTDGHTVTLTAGTYDSSATTATLDAAEETLVLFGLSATRFVVVSNIGTIVLS